MGVSGFCSPPFIQQQCCTGSSLFILLLKDPVHTLFSEIWDGSASCPCSSNFITPPGSDRKLPLTIRMSFNSTSAFHLPCSSCHSLLVDSDCLTCGWLLHNYMLKTLIGNGCLVVNCVYSSPWVFSYLVSIFENLLCARYCLVLDVQQWSK